MRGQRSNASRLCGMLLSAALGLLLTGCSTLTTLSPETDAASLQATARQLACGAFKPITYSKTKDTVETKVQIQGHNSAWAALCSQDPLTQAIDNTAN